MVTQPSDSLSVRLGVETVGISISLIAGVSGRFRRSRAGGFAGTHYDPHRSQGGVTVRSGLGSFRRVRLRSQQCEVSNAKSAMRSQYCEVSTAKSVLGGQNPRSRGAGPRGTGSRLRIHSVLDVLVYDMSPRAADSTPSLAASRPQTAWQWVRLIGNVVNLTTLLGLAVGAFGGATFRSGPRGLILGEHYRFTFPVAGAFTIGNVSTTARDWDTLLRDLPTLLTHEERHTWQYLYCLGL